MKKKLYKDDSDVVIAEVAARVHSSRVDTKQRAAAPSSAASTGNGSGAKKRALAPPQATDDSAATAANANDVIGGEGDDGSGCKRARVDS